MWDLLASMQFEVHGGGSSGLINLLDGVLDTLGSWAAQPSETLFETILPGVAVLKNLHPLVVHYPIALLSLFILFDWLAPFMRQRETLFRFASGLLYCGALLAGVAVVAGLVAAETVAHGDEVHEIMESHEHLGISVWLLSSLLALSRFWGKSADEDGAASVRPLFLLLTAVLAVLLVLTADLGGLMVYGHGVAVAPVEAEQAEHYHEHQHDS
jgi:uncharacterized membrane protein